MKKSVKQKTISAQHKLFADTYLSNGFKGQEAAISAKYSAGRARITASEILTRPEVQAYINERMKKAQMGADEALYRLGGQAKGDVSEFIGLTPDELRVHPRSWLIKKIKIGVYFPDKPETAPKDKELAVSLFAKVIAQDDQSEAAQIEREAYKPIHYVEYVELYDSQSALLNILKQHQLAKGLPTEIIHIAPTINRLVELLTESGNDPAQVFERMIQRIAQESDV